MPAIFWPGLGNSWEHAFPGIPMNQLSLLFEPGLGERYGSLRECLTTQVYSRGLVKVAGGLDLSPSKLTEKLAGVDSGGAPRGLTVDELEAYITKYGDITPVLYLAAKYCRDPKVVQAEATAALTKLLEQIPALAAAAGLSTSPARARKAS